MDEIEKEKLLHTNYFALRLTTNNSIKFSLVILFVFSVFLLSNDDTLKIASMNASAMTAILMLAIYIFDGLIRGRFILQRHSFQKLLLLLFLWALISLLFSKMDPSKAIPDESYSYAWATGLNSPDWRGVSFLLRLFLTIFAIEFIVANVNTDERYFKVINYFIFAYLIVCLFVFVQIFLYGFINITVGYILPSRFEGYFPVGGYTGESGTLAGMLASGYFILLVVTKEYYTKIWFSNKLLKVLYIIATIDLIFTFSAAWIVAVLLSIFIVGRKYLGNKIIIFLLILGLTAGIFSTVFREVIIGRAISESFSTNVRTDSWRAGLHIFEDNLITGVGIGQSVFYMPIYMVKISNILGEEDLLDMRFPPMNTYIQWMAETGFIGLLLLFGIIYYIVKYSRTLKENKYQKLVKYGFGGGLLTVAIAMNAGPDNLYVGYIHFLLAMYISGIKLFGRNEKEH